MPFVLIVDDDSAIRENLCDLFAGAYFCQSAASAEEALVMMESERFDVVVTDISMPGMSGLELFGQIRQREPDTPVIFLSGIGDETYRAGVLALGAYAYHFKPYKLTEIETTVAAAVEHHRELIAARRSNAEGKLNGQAKLFALSMCAAKENGGETAHDAKVIFAASEAEAKHKGFYYANEKWPRNESWVEHRIVAVEIQQDVIAKAATFVPHQE